MRKAYRKLVFTKVAVITAAGLIGVFGFAKFSSDYQKAGASASGPSASHTNAPDEGNCTACHSDFALNSGTGNVIITGLTPNYLPNQQIPLTVTVNQSDGVVYGFQLTAIDSQGRRAGNYVLPPASPQPLQAVNGIVNGNERRYVEHTIDGVNPTQFGTKSWNFTWTAPAQRIGKIGFYVAGNGGNSDGGTSGDYIYASSKSTLTGTAISSFDGDGTSEVGVFRPSTGVWYSQNSTDGNVLALQFGINGDKIAPGDFDGDGKTDYAIFRPSNGAWYLYQSTAGFFATTFGTNGDVPVAGDYDGDLKTDIAVWRPSTGVWYLLQSTAGFAVFQFGTNGDKTTPGDFDGDGKTDVAVFRPSSGVWYVQRSSSSLVVVQFGTTGDKPVQGDYDGDGKTDIALFRPSNSGWYLLKSTEGIGGVVFGFSTDIPTPADFDGDGKTDVAVYRDGVWYAQRSSDGTFYIALFGSAGDVPIPAGYLAE